MPEAPTTSMIDTAAPFLPGIAHDLPIALDEDELEQLPIFTASQVFARDEYKYRLAVALFFGEGISLRGVCRICGISPHTMQSIIRREQNGVEADKWRKAASGDIRALVTMALSVAGDMLADKKMADKAGYNGIASLLRELSHAHELLNQRLPGQQDANKLTPEQQAEIYIQSQAQARRQSIEVPENSDVTRGANDADQAESEG